MPLHATARRGSLGFCALSFSPVTPNPVRAPAACGLLQGGSGSSVGSNTYCAGRP
jgi:hypothetical protein